jgi:putative peptide zinc metalloprotease protein
VLWYVIEDPVTNNFFRLNEYAYQFLGLLDGQLTVEQAWNRCMEEDPDGAPTQGEVIELLGNLYQSNLIQSEVPSDAAALFERYAKRKSKEVRGKLASVLFIRIPLYDPDLLLNRWSYLVQRFFTRSGAIALLFMMAAGIVALIASSNSLSSGFSGIMTPNNLPFLYLAFVLIKVLHEAGHAFSCKVFGHREGAGGEVHAIGIMFLVFIPVPYVDASSAWALRSKAGRVVVGTAGMMMEMVVASIAAIIWACTDPLTGINAFCYNLMFVAGVSTILFNGNPLLRYDGYYILCDLLEIPNLATRARTHVRNVLRKNVLGVHRVIDVTESKSEKTWLMIYAITSGLYRVFIYAMIMLFLASLLPIAAVLLVVYACITWIFIPTGKFIHYLTSSPDLDRCRPRAILVTASATIALIILVGILPLPDHVRGEGVVESENRVSVFSIATGTVDSLLSAGTRVSKEEDILLSATSKDEEAKLAIVSADLVRLQTQKSIAMRDAFASVAPLSRMVDATKRQQAWVLERMQSLQVRSPIDGVWIPSENLRRDGAVFSQGDSLGLVVDDTSLVVRAIADQRTAALIIKEGSEIVEMRLAGNPSKFSYGEIERIVPAGSDELPSAVLGTAAGGEAMLDPSDVRGGKLIDAVFEIWIHLDQDVAYLPGQRVAVRFELKHRSLGSQVWRFLRQVVQKRLRF